MEITLAVILGIAAAGAFLAAAFSFKEKGVLLNNAWLYASKEERERMDKTPYYRQTGVVFLLIGLMLVLSCLEVTLHEDRLFYGVILTAAAALVYGIVSTVIINRSQEDETDDRHL